MSDIHQELLEVDSTLSFLEDWTDKVIEMNEDEKVLHANFLIQSLRKKVLGLAAKSENF